MIQENTKLTKVFKLFSMILLLLLTVSCSSQVSQSFSEPEEIHYDKQFIVRNYTFKEKISGYAKDLIESYDEITERVDLNKSSAALEELQNLISAVEHGFEVDADYWHHVGSHYNPTFVFQVAAQDCVSNYSFQFYETETLNSCTKFQTDPESDGLRQHPYDPSKSAILGEMIRIKNEIGHRVWACDSPTGDWKNGECINYCTGWAATIYYKVYRNIFPELFPVDSEEFKRYIRVPASNGYSMASAFGEPSNPHSKYFTVHEIKTVDDFKQYAISGSIFSRYNMGHVIFIEGVDTANDIVFQSEGAVVRGLPDNLHGVFVHSGFPIQTWLEYQGCSFAGCFIAVPNPEIRPYARSVLECDFFSTGFCQTYRDEESELYDPSINGVTQNLFNWEYAGIIR